MDRRHCIYSRSKALKCGYMADVVVRRLLLIHLSDWKRIEALRMASTILESYAVCASGNIESGNHTPESLQDNIESRQSLFAHNLGIPKP